MSLVEDTVDVGFGSIVAIGIRQLSAEAVWKRTQ